MKGPCLHRHGPFIEVEFDPGYLTRVMMVNIGR